MSAAPEEVARVPLKIDGVIVGVLEVDDKHALGVKITAPGTQSYLKEMLLAGLVEGISLFLDYVGEEPDHVPTRGHLRLVKEL